MDERQESAGRQSGDDGAVAPRTFYADGGINVETYDVRTVGFSGEIEWWVRQAVASGGPVLEVACGTGRVTWPIARAGIPVVGLDLATGMLRAAESKRGSESQAVSDRIRFAHGDMTDFSIAETFAIVIIPSRAFQALLTPAAQRSSLTSIHRHLRPGGRLIVDLFDPRLDWLLPDRVAPPVPDRPRVTHPIRGTTVTIDVLERTNDALRQVLCERWRFTELGAADEVLRREDEILELRWTYRYEMRHLLELCGFTIEREISDFHDAPPAYGREQIWLVQKGVRGA